MERNIERFSSPRFAVSLPFQHGEPGYYISKQGNQMRYLATSAVAAMLFVTPLGSEEPTPATAAPTTTAPAAVSCNATVERTVVVRRAIRRPLRSLVCRVKDRRVTRHAASTCTPAVAATTSAPVVAHVHATVCKPHVHRSKHVVRTKVVRRHLLATPATCCSH